MVRFLWDLPEARRTVSHSCARDDHQLGVQQPRELLDPAGLVADLYVDGALVAQQSAGLDLYVTPRIVHVVEAKNVTDPMANGLYRYNDASQRATPYP